MNWQPSDLAQLLEERPDIQVDVPAQGRPLTDRTLVATLSQVAGAEGESTAEGLLRALGVKMVADMPTPFVIVQRHPTDAGFVRIVRKESVFGDISGILPGGIRVLAEVKNYSQERLSITALKPHQVKALDENRHWGGLSLLIWIAPHGRYVMEWPIPGWRKGKRLTREMALANLWPSLSEETAQQKGRRL